MQPIPVPKPFAELRLAFAALSARADEIGALVLGGMLDYFLHRRLEKKLAKIIADLRLALLHRAFDIVTTLGPYRPRPLPEPATFDEEFDDIESEPEPEPEQIKAPRTRTHAVILWPVGRTGHDNSEGRAPYYFVPDAVCTRRLIGRFGAVARIFADIDRYARKLAFILTRPPRWVRHDPDIRADYVANPVVWRRNEAGFLKPVPADSPAAAPAIIAADTS